MRVYLASTLSALAELHKSGGIAPAPLAAYAVTPALREWYAEGDTEELEHVALTHAARASLRLLADEAGDHAVGETASAPALRRVVLAADIADADARQCADIDVAAVCVDNVVEFSAVVSAHLDDADAAADIAAGIRALAVLDTGNDDAQFAVDSVDDHELLWFAAQEIASLIEYWSIEREEL